MPTFLMLADAGGGFAIAYLIGSIPSGVLLTRLAGVGDVGRIGSGNISATNVMRTGQRVIAAVTVILDGLMGVLAVVIGVWTGGDWPPLIAAVGVVLGHLFPVWIDFRGGKGVATYLGALMVVSPFSAATFAMAWLAVASVSRRSSAGTLAATLVALVTIYAQEGSLNSPLPPPLQPDFMVFAILTVVLLLRHAGNIVRLFQGTEPRFGEV